MPQPQPNQTDLVDQTLAQTLAQIEKQVGPESGLNELQLIQFYVRLREAINESLEAIESLMESD